MFLFRKDLYLPAADLWIDPHRPKPFAFVSHAHGDHIERHNHILATPETAHLVEHRLGPRQFTRLAFGEWLTLNDRCRVRLHPAGHILGSAQLEVEQEGRRMVYTGDFRLKPSETAELGVIVPCDMLVMECTYGRAHYKFPPREEVVPALIEDLRQCLAADQTPVLLAYTLGRGQELLKLLEPAGFDVHLAPPIHAMTRMYEELGVTFGPYQRARPGATNGAVVFVPPHGQRGRLMREMRDPVRIAATGWALDGQKGPPYPTDRSYALSDHADFDELKDYVARCGATEVYTMHGFDEFREHLRSEGVSAHPVEARMGR